MPRAPVEPVFVSRQTAAERLEISTDTFDTWLRAGFIPAPQIDRGQIVRWHWPSLEERLAGPGDNIAQSEASTGSLAHVPKPKVRRRAAA